MTLHRDAPDVHVFVNGARNDDWHVIDCSLGSTAATLPRATLEVQPPQRDKGRPLVLLRRLAQFDQPAIEIVKGTQVVHWGKAVARPASIGPDGDAYTVISRMEAHHFGLPLYLAYFRDPRGGRPAGFPLPSIFNPEWDGRIVFNESPQKHPLWGTFLLVHPASLETTDGRRYHRANPAREWLLPDVVHYLCWALNFNQTYVRNPTRAELVRALPSDTGLIRNHECPPGAYLPELLDRLLAPFGCAWKVQLARGSRKIACFQRGKGPPRLLKLQAPGATLDMDKSNLEALSLMADVSTRGFNAVRVIGEFKRYEATFELFRGWPETLDAESFESVVKDVDAWKTNQQLENVHRKWILNEGGDYNNLRPEIGGPYDFSAIFAPDAWLPRRRKFECCLTQRWDDAPMGLAHGVYLEWWDSSGGDDGSGAWRSIEELSPEGRQFKVLQRECGIYFDGFSPPCELMDQTGAEAKLRITACVYGDARAEVRVIRWPASPLQDLKEQHFQVGTRFKIHKRDKSSRFAATHFTHADADDTAEMRAFANRLLDEWNLTNLDGTATLTGVDYLYNGLIGSTISGINGRNVTFNLAPPGAPPRYPSVVGARIDFANQKLDLTLDTFRVEGRA
ncbi:MAG: hypothetical protein M3Q42_11770 [Pseudomonadota bacterium]|nr:hypothetical protein [Pseudomonadota bacterium]